ncbi:putative ABC transporter permease [Butyrivibrio sp. INlla16]|uniref:putative ABC transporter permease n=1 Tax=Butyrivibrio sp. INlla16 TaxID=1520807 RepID=UPI000890F435|nr:putative ABC transporter permease [Butyrivibrio sp. INlla16]SDB50127.1 Uncharacterized membrane protein [Butyrivibrio sp. INlla16]
MEGLSRDFYELMMIAAIASFTGYVVENVWLLCTKHYIDNRNMFLPFLIGYGMTFLAFYTLFGTPSDPHFLMYRLNLQNSSFWYTVIAFFAVCIGEIALGESFYIVMGFDYWNYEWVPMHITKYTSVPTSIGFAVLITWFMDTVYPVLATYTAEMDYEMLKNVSIILTIAMIVDYFISFSLMARKRTFNVVWRFSTKEGLALSEHLA